MDEELIKTLAQIIKDYRKNEIGHELDAQHIIRWLTQFDENCREVILKETVHVFQEWYFAEDHFNLFIDSILNFLCKQYSLSEYKLVDNAIFLETQAKENSQTKILQRLRDIIKDRYGTEIRTTGESAFGLYVYLDDGIYTGTKARRDITEVLSKLPTGSTLYVFYMVAGMQGLRYSKNKLKEKADEYNVQFKVYRMHPIENARWVDHSFDENGDEQISYPAVHACLWPIERVKEIPEVAEYITSYITPYDNKEKHLFRDKYWKEDKGVFTSAENRNIVEREFLLKGIKLAQHSQNNGIHPLGFNAWPSLGFGSFCATYMNISNTCPLVLWWGNIEEKGDVLDSWYPLLPRRVGSLETDEAYEEPVEETQISYDKNDQYYMCPDCGRYYGIMEDGGNGFCIDCAWKH